MSITPKPLSWVNDLDSLAASAGLGPELPLASSDDIGTRWRGHKGGCKHCNHTGFRGSVGVSEVCVPTDELLQLLRKRTELSSLQKQAIDDGMIDLPTDALVKVSAA